MGGEALLRPGGPADALALHEPGHLVPAHVEPLVAGGPGELPASVDGVVLLPDGLELWSEVLVTDLPSRVGPRLGVVVGGRGDLQLLADRLDPPSTPTGRVLPVGVDERHY